MSRHDELKAALLDVLRDLKGRSGAADQLA